MTTNFDNAHRHIYLYAKGWYKETNQFSDLQVLIGELCGLDPKYVKEKDINQILLGIVWDIFQREGLNEWKFFKFVVECQSRGIITECLSHIALSNMVEYNIDLGNPDPNVMPLKNKE